jgi:hypothetical protein
MNIKLIVLLIISLAIVACERGADLDNIKIYENSGVSFKYPGNWNVTEDSIVDEVRFIFVESPGAGIMKVEIYNYEDSFELREFVVLDIDAVLSEMPSVLKVAKPDLIVNLEKEISGKAYKGLMYEIDMSILGIELPHITEVFEFVSDSKTAYLSGQVATEDSHLVGGGFDLIVSSFKFSKSLTNNSSETPKSGTH